MAIDFPSSPTNGQLQIGNNGAGSFPLTGDIGEIIIVSGDLTTTQRNDCEAYLRNKWGTPAPP